MTTTQPEITQADRDAWQSMTARYGPVIDEMLRAGKLDGTPEMQALARHRTTSAAPLVEALEQVRLVLEEAAYSCQGCSKTCGPVAAVNEAHETIIAALAQYRGEVG